MDYSQILRNADTTLQKNVQKALLCINDIGKMETSAKQADASQVTKAAFALEKAFRASKGTGQGLQAAAAAQGFRIMTVQFNPEQIHFSSEPISGKDEKKQGAQPDKLLSKAVQTVMNLSLIFEEIHETDAFMWDKQNVLLNGSIKDKLKASSIASTFYDYSVKTQIEGLLSLIANSTTRNVVFCWGNMALSGMIKNEKAEYTMFNPSGNPIRGMVTLSIALHYGEKKTDNGKYWDKAFDQLFTVKKMNLSEDVTNTVGTINRLVSFHQ